MFENQCFLIIKPDAIKRKLIGKIISKIEEGSDLTLTKCAVIKPEKEKIEKWYDQKDKFSKKDYPPKKIVTKYLLSEPLILIVWKGTNAVEKIRKIVGNTTNPPDSKNGTIRKDLGIDTIEKATKERRAVENLVHASRTNESAEREIKFWFGK